MALADLSRGQWGGANSDIDQHIEEHLGLVDKAFQYSSKLAPITNIRSLRGSNVVRIDRIGDVTVQGRQSGTDLQVTPVRSDKYNLTVDTVLYTRHQFDKFDDWTSSIDMRAEVAQADGIALAKQFDLACITAAIKCGDFAAPAHLKDAFRDGILLPTTIAGTQAAGEADADLLVYAHRQGIQKLVERDLGDQVMSEGITLVTPRIFSVLLEHRRLMNVEFQGGSSENDFARRRVGVMNGIRVMETPRFPGAAITSSPLGAAFNVTAAQARRQMVTIIPSLTLVAAQVHELSADYWEWKEKFSHVLDTFQSYNIGQRRPDAAAVHDITITNP